MNGRIAAPGREGSGLLASGGVLFEFTSLSDSNSSMLLPRMVGEKLVDNGIFVPDNRLRLQSRLVLSSRLSLTAWRGLLLLLLILLFLRKRQVGRRSVHGGSG